MNQTLESDELDRRLVELNHGKGFMDCDRVRIGKQSLTFYQQLNGKHESYAGNDTRITFKKRNFNGTELEFHVEWNEFQYERCSLGHLHQKSKIEREFKTFHIAWEYVEQLIEWLQLGSWTEVNGKDDTPIKLLKETVSILELMSKSESSFKPQMRALRSKIKEFIE